MNGRLVVLSSAAAMLGAYVLAGGEGSLLSGVLQSSDPGAAQTSLAGAVPGASAANGKSREGITLNPLQGLDAQSFTAIVEQPLFNPGRAPRPADPAPAPEPSAAPEPEPVAEDPGPLATDYKLLAVSSGPAGQVAALRLNQTGEVVFVQEGQDVQPWKVLAIGPRSIVIGTPERNVELSMFESGSEPPVSPVEGGEGTEMPVQGEKPENPPPEGIN